MNIWAVTSKCWISVDSRLPEMRETYRNSPLQSERVLIFNGMWIDIGIYGETSKTRQARWIGASGQVERQVTHWMPLPNSPGGDA